MSSMPVRRRVRLRVGRAYSLKGLPPPNRSRQRYSHWSTRNNVVPGSTQRLVQNTTGHKLPFESGKATVLSDFVYVGVKLSEGLGHTNSANRKACTITSAG
jgi:hypothetical protein